MWQRGWEALRHLITGGAGFIGSHLVDALAARAERVTVLDDLSTGRLSNIQHLVDSDAVALVEGSVQDPELVDDLVREADVCVHLAAAVGVKLVVAQPLHSLLTNMRGADIILDACARHNCRVLFASSSEIYGRNAEALDESADRILGPYTQSRWQYALAKSVGEELCVGYHRERGLHTTVVRLFNTVGPRQSPAYGMVLPRFVRQALAGEEVTVYGNGTQRRCFTHVADVVHALLLLLDPDAEPGHVFNVASEEEIAIVELARRVIERTGSASTIRLVRFEDAYEPDFVDPWWRRPDVTALRGATGWRAVRTVDEAIDDLIAYERNRIVPQRSPGA